MDSIPIFFFNNQFLVISEILDTRGISFQMLWPFENSLKTGTNRLKRRFDNLKKDKDKNDRG